MHSFSFILVHRGKEHPEEQEIVPLYVWFYDAVLNFIWPPFNYFRLHMLYISLLSILGSSPSRVLSGKDKPSRAIPLDPIAGCFVQEVSPSTSLN